MEVLGDSYNLGVAAILIILMLLMGWRVLWDVRFRWRLPPGSMGYPLLGESLAFLYNVNSKPVKFFEERQARYGELFKSHLFGEPVVVSTSASVNNFVFQKEGVLFQSAYPATLVELLGEETLGETHGELHSRLRGMVMRLIGPAALPDYVGEVEASIVKRLHSWETSPLIYLHEEACQISLDVVVNRVVSLSSEDHVEARLLMESFRRFTENMFGFPINLPGTAYHSCVKGRAQVVDLIEKIIMKRTQSKTQFRRDLLDMLLEEEKNNDKIFKRKKTMDIMVSVIFAAFETTATAITVVVKLISKHQDVLEKLMVEHMAIKDKKSTSNAKELTWEDYKSMSYTRDVLFETLRLVSMVPFVYREALKDVDINGFVIPKGWKVLTCLSTPHLNSTNFSDPLSFIPSRWKEIDSTSGNSSCLMPFGGGLRLCLGKEMALLEISIFLHHFITKYRWEEVGQEKFISIQCVRFKNGYPLRLQKK